MTRNMGVDLGEPRRGASRSNPLDLINNVKFPNPNDLPQEAKEIYDKIIEKDPTIGPCVANFMAWYVYNFTPQFPVFVCTAFEIDSFKKLINPNHEWFNPIFQNVLEANQSLRDEIAAVVI
jgi:hypothetical protein